MTRTAHLTCLALVKEEDAPDASQEILMAARSKLRMLPNLGDQE